MNGFQKPRILFINRSYWPDSEATGQLLTSLCEDLAQEFDVEVIAGRPNHEQEQFNASTVGVVRRRGVTIHRVLHTRFPKSSWIGRLLNLTTFTASAFLTSLWRSPRPDLVVTETDPFFLPILGRFLKWRYRIPFIAYLQDVYPDIAIALGKAGDGKLTQALRKTLVNCYNNADQVVVLSEDMKARCVKNGVAASQFTIIPNWADCDQIRPIKQRNQFREKYGLEEKFVVMYSGNLGLAHMLEPIIDAANNLKDQPEVVFVVIGEGVQKVRLQQLAEARGLQNVLFLSYQPREFLEHSLSAADVQIVSMLPEVKGCVMPSKLYGVLASGTSVLSLAPADCDLSRLVNSEELGAVCDPSPAETVSARLSESIRLLASDPELVRQQGLRGRALCLEEYDRPLQVKRFTQLLQRLTDESRIPVTEPMPKIASKTTSSSKLHVGH